MMRLHLDAGWLHVAVMIGPDEPQGQGERDSTLDALVEMAGPDPDRRAELDGRPVGFRGWIAPRRGGYSAVGPDRKSSPPPGPGCASPRKDRP